MEKKNQYVAPEILACVILPEDGILYEFSGYGNQQFVKEEGPFDDFEEE